MKKTRITGRSESSVYQVDVIVNLFIVLLIIFVITAVHEIVRMEYRQLDTGAKFFNIKTYRPIYPKKDIWILESDALWKLNKLQLARIALTIPTIGAEQNHPDWTILKDKTKVIIRPDPKGLDPLFYRIGVEVVPGSTRSSPLATAVMPITQNAETDDMTVSDHAISLIEHVALNSTRIWDLFVLPGSENLASAVYLEARDHLMPPSNLLSVDEYSMELGIIHEIRPWGRNFARD